MGGGYRLAKCRACGRKHWTGGSICPKCQSGLVGPMFLVGKKVKLKVRDTWLGTVVGVLRNMVAVAPKNSVMGNIIYYDPSQIEEIQLPDENDLTI